MDSASIERDLTEHGLAFLVRSVTSMRGSDDRGPLFAIVDLAVAIEVLLKARLVREHWSLICAQPDKTSVAQFEAGLAKTVSPEQSVIRLDGIAGLTLKTLGHDKRIEKIRQLRNRVVHFTVPTDDASIGVATVYGHALNFALWFLDNEFRGKANGDIEELVEEVIEQLTSELRYIQELVSDRMGTIDETLDGADVCVDCPRCEQPALMLFEQSQSVYCGYCLWNPQDGSSAAQEYEEAVLGGSYNESAGPGGPVWDCPRCSSPGLGGGGEATPTEPGIVVRRRLRYPTTGLLGVF